jgi:DNA polymerase III subunit epsilon
MTFIIIDVETSGLPIMRGFAKLHPPHDFNYYQNSRVIELAAIEYNEDAEILSCISTRVRPSGQWTMNPKSQQIHGIDESDLADGTGGVVDTQYALAQLQEQIEAAYARNPGVTPVVVGHNVSFDWHVLSAEAYRAGYFVLFELLCGLQWHCTMHANTRLCGLKRKNGLMKWPTLAELYRYIFHEELRDQHSALGDVRSTARCFFELMNRQSGQPSKPIEEQATDRFKDENGRYEIKKGHGIKSQVRVVLNYES